MYDERSWGDDMTTPPVEDEARVREVGPEVRQAARARNRLGWEHPFPRTGRVLHARDRIPSGTGEGEDVRPAALLVALITIIVGIAGLVSPDSVTTVRRLYFATPLGLYAATAVRVAMGIVLILCAPASRAPKILRVLGAVMCLQGLAATISGPERARTILGWESIQGPAVLRAGAAVALVTGGFLGFAVTSDGPKNRAQ
jgi:hypothetical protein